jgi:hypothetical protein
MMIRLVYRALTGMNGETGFAMVAIAASHQTPDKGQIKTAMSSRRQRLLDPFAAAAERIVGQHPHDGFDVAASGTVMLVPIGTI